MYINIIMKYINYISSFLIIVGIGYIYEKLKIGNIHNKDNTDYELVTKYLLNDIKNYRLPFIWIHIDNHKNARNWDNFKSRTNNELNTPYIDLTIQTIINKCKDDFNICLLNDESFKTLLPNWNINMSRLADPIKSKCRELAVAKVLHKFGGIYLPPSFVCIKNLKKLYDIQQYTNKLFVGELINDMVNPESLCYYPSNTIMIANKNCQQLKEYIEYLEHLISKDNTHESIFLKSVSYYLNNKISEKNIELISAEYIGTRDNNKNKITLDRLFEDNDIPLHDNCIGIYVDNNSLLKRKKYNWFCYLSLDELVEVNNYLAGKIRDLLL